MGLKDLGETLPPGFRFYPSDEELVCHYLRRKIVDDIEPLGAGTLIDIDLHTCEPWQLPDVAKLNASEWYFFNFRDRKYATGFRTNRATTTGYWKATGKDRVIHDPNTRQVVGMRKTLVFYKNRAPNGMKTGWIMHEFRLETPQMPPKEDWVLCRVFHKGKGEGNSEHNPYLIDTTRNTSPPPLANIDQNTVAYGYHYQGSNSITANLSQTQDYTRFQNPNAHSSTNLLNPGTNHNLTTFDDAMAMDHFSSKSHDADQYGLWWDMGFDDNNNNNITHHHQYRGFGDVRFEDDNGTVFLS